MGIGISVDKFTPCLEDAETGSIVQTSFSRATKDDLYQAQQLWKFNWIDDGMKEAQIYKLTVVDKNEVEGLIAVSDISKDRAMYICLAESAPHNLGKNKKYIGVGGHLFAIAAQESVKRGYGGFMFLDAKNIELVKHYERVFGAIHLGGVHPYRMVIEEDKAVELIKKYTLKEDWEYDNER